MNPPTQQELRAMAYVYRHPPGLPAWKHEIVAAALERWADEMERMKELAEIQRHMAETRFDSAMD